MQHHSKPAPDVPNWSALLVEAVNKPGLIMEAYSAFHNYSIGNQILALVQCQLRGLEPGPINTFPGWQALGRTVKRGERALILCMPISRKVRDKEAPESNGENGERRFTSFMHKARWFAISQTVGDEFTPPRLPEWEAERALAALDIEQIAFTATDGKCQGYAKKRQIAINPVAQLPHKTLFHETAHVILGHTSEADFTDTERTPKNLREVEAEAVVDSETVRSGFASACKKAEITCGQTKAGGITWHDLRHTFATRLRGERVHELDIMQLLGHSSLGVTAGYAHGTRTVIQNAVDKLAEPRGTVVEFARAG
jgi:hypothetical protein